ncbi:siderophore-interacting protein [Pseudactinotalea terrae]|uniref:siderophore-interacting protein n=1 Tax=Pseudactinotalea terrae TaxID=1743262 RepID=UPI0012E150E9|nr:siderophore-interacting protein [Pseudactinotalea terrae]
MADGRGRGQRPQTVLEVIRTERLSPHLTRVVAGGPGFRAFQNNEYSDRYVKLLFADPAAGLEPPYDLETLRAERPEALPRLRTYTVRWVDVEAQELAIDFVIHGDDGVAGPWAATAQPGEPLVMNGPGGGYAPDPDADWHLLVGDLSSLPAIAAALEDMPADAVGHALIQVEDDGDVVDLVRPPGIEVTWVRERGDQALVDAVRALRWRHGDVQAFVHGEREATKLLRRLLTDERGIDRGRLSVSAYWAQGRVEDQFQAEKREPVGQI